MSPLRRLSSRVSRSRAAALLAGSCLVLGASTVVRADPPAAAPAPTSIFGIPIPSGWPIPTAFPSPAPAPAASGAPAPGATGAPAPTTFFGIPIPSGLPAILQQAPYLSPQGVLVMPGTGEPVNMQVLAQILSGKQGNCGTNEVSPGQYVKLDCRPYAQMISVVSDVFDPAKLDLLSKGQLHVTPAAPVPAPQGGREGLPAAVDHRSQGLEGPIKDQGLVGDCSAFSLSSVVDNAIRRMQKNDVISPEHIWAHYGSSDMGQAGDTNLNRPIALNQTWPYSQKQACELDRDSSDECGRLLNVTPASASNDAALQAQYRQAEAAGVYRITQISRITSKPQINVDAVAAVLASGADIWAGFDVDVNSWKNVSGADATIRDWGTPNSGHAVALAGYRQAPGGGGRQFLVHNSWGGRWGDSGFAWLSEAMVSQHLQIAYKVTLVDPRAPAAGAQTDDDCPSGSLVDSVTKQCAPACPGGGRKAGGKC